MNCGPKSVYTPIRGTSLPNGDKGPDNINQSLGHALRLGLGLKYILIILHS